MPKQSKSRSSQRTKVQPTTAQSSVRANSADVVQTTQYAEMPTETLCFLLSQGRLVQSGPRQQLIARLQANDSQDSTSPPTGPATMPDQQLASMIASIVEQKLATLNSASNSLSSSTSGVVQPSAQQSAQQHLPGVTSLAPDPSLPPVRNGGQQQIPSSLDFSLSSSQQDLNLGTPEDAALLHTNYRVPSIASHLSNSCIAAITNGEYVDLASLLPFSSLLRDHVTANSQLKLQVGNEGLTIPLPSQAKRPKITGIDRWLDAFAIYSSVLLSSYPSRGVDLFAYQQLIRESARKFPGMAWYLYDMEFRRRASHNLSINWGQRDVQLYLDTFTGVPKAILCKACSSSDHVTDSCPLSPRSKDSSGPKLGDLCLNFNKGVFCTRTPCPYTHQCHKPECTAVHAGKDHPDSLWTHPVKG